MRLDKRVVAFKLAFTLVLPLFFSGCVLLPDEQESRGVKLSDAMKASAAGDQRDLGGRHSSPDYFSDTDDSYSNESSSSDGSGFGMDATVTYDKREYNWQVLLDTSYWQPINSDFAGITHFTLTPIAVESEDFMLGLYVGGAVVDLKSGSLPQRATDRAWMLDAGMAGRVYLNHSRTALSPYLAANVGFTLLDWSYRSPVTVDGDTIQSDALYGAEGTLGIGISTRRDYRLSAFAEAGLGGTVFSDTTVNGFDNNVFHNFGFLSFKAGISLKF